MFTCPVCGYAQLRYPPEDFTICPSCSTEFGYDDANRSYEQLRQLWIQHGVQWHSGVVRQPENWNGWEQLIKAGFAYELPYAREMTIQSSGPKPTLSRSATAPTFYAEVTR